MFYYRLIKFMCCFFLSAFIIGCIFLTLLFIYNKDENLILLNCTLNVVCVVNFIVIKLLLDDIKRNIERLKKQKRGEDFYKKFTDYKKNSKLN